MKEDLAPLVTELLSLKETYKKVTGEDYGGVKKEETKTKNVDFKNRNINQFNLFFQKKIFTLLYLLFCLNQVPNEGKQPVIIIQPNSDVTFPKNKNYFDIAEKYIYLFKTFFINALVLFLKIYIFNLHYFKVMRLNSVIIQ